MSGLTKKRVTVRTKKGKTFQRSVMVRAGEAIKRSAAKVGSFVSKNKGKIAVIGAVGATSYALHRYGTAKAYRHGVKTGWSRANKHQNWADSGKASHWSDSVTPKQGARDWHTAWALKVAIHTAGRPKRFRELGDRDEWTNT